MTTLATIARNAEGVHDGKPQVFLRVRALVEPMAFDRDTRESVRRFDDDGCLHVAVTNISKACVSEYQGREIPNWEALGLAPDKLYRLLRDPDELAKAAASFNNRPLLNRHVAVTADDHQPDLVIGSTGTDAEFVAPYLRNSLVVWSREPINDIEAQVREELSAAYRYRADMTPGSYEGERYDGVMRDIVGNHVALVKEGRAGPDVVVGDSKQPQQEFALMSTGKPIVLSRKATAMLGALVAYIKPKLAQDAAINFYPMLTGVSAKNFKEKRPAMVVALKKELDGKLAKDASLDDVEKVLDMLDGHDIQEGLDADPNSGLPMTKLPGPAKQPAKDEGDHEELRAYLATKGLSPEDVEAAIALLTGGAPAAIDAENPFAKKDDKDKKDDEDDDDDDKDKPAKDTVSKAAMDSAIAAAVKGATEKATRVQREIRDAERAIRPYVGELAIAFDSADAVYRAALKHMGVKDAETIHASALPTILGMQRKASDPPVRETRIAQDAAGEQDFNKRFPNAAKIAVA